MVAALCAHKNTTYSLFWAHCPRITPLVSILHEQHFIMSLFFSFLEKTPPLGYILTREISYINYYLPGCSTEVFNYSSTLNTTRLSFLTRLPSIYLLQAMSTISRNLLQHMLLHGHRWVRLKSKMEFHVFDRTVETYVLWVFLTETLMLGTLLTITEEPLGMRPSSSVYSEK